MTACRGTVGSSRGRDLRHAESGWEVEWGQKRGRRPGAGRQGRERVVQQHHKVSRVGDHMMEAEEGSCQGFKVTLAPASGIGRGSWGATIKGDTPDGEWLGEGRRDRGVLFWADGLWRC